MKTKLLLSGIAVLFLATGTAQANEDFDVQCGNKRVHVYGHHGWEFTEIRPGDIKGQQGSRLLSKRFFRMKNDAIYFHGRKCRNLCYGFEECGG
jgi:hypothetical protein